MNDWDEPITRREQLAYVDEQVRNLVWQTRELRNKEPASQANEFVQMLSRNLCTKYQCTTCGNLPYRKAAKKLGTRFFNSMMELKEYQVIQYPNILEYVNIGFYCISDLGERQRLAEHWPNIVRILSVGTRRTVSEIIHGWAFQEFLQ
ncbi:MAG TPA: hypothetical protein VLA21_01720 [Candidatus Limnocylindria bacterium]|nr:hypothetical protein [Candidatus Limnocylindria bacterium]